MHQTSVTKTLDQQSALLENIQTKKVRPPRGVKFDSPIEKSLWSRLTAARSPQDWRAMDLDLLVKICRLERQIDEQQTALDAEGYICENDKGTRTANPRANIIHQMQNRQLSLLRGLALTIMHTTKTASPTSERAEETKKKASTAGSKKSFRLMA